jgi:acetyltransferase-like isoleucine patch superfamily enzyme
MSLEHTLLPDGRWTEGSLPDNVRVGTNTLISGPLAFQRFRSTEAPGLIVGPHCTMDHVQFAVGPSGRLEIGSYCYFTSVVLLCELELRIGSYVAIGWNTTISDSDFHPMAPAARIEDAIACSPLGKGRRRPRISSEPVIIEDDVYIGANAVILKGVRIGSGAVIEPGALVTRDVPPGCRAMGNPAQLVDGDDVR